VELETDGLGVERPATGEINERYDAYVTPLANAFRPGYEPQLTQLTKADPGELRARIGAGSA
jgi:hypothetical protein